MRTTYTLFFVLVSLTCFGQSINWVNFEKAWDNYLASPTHGNSIKAYNLLPDKVMGVDYPDKPTTYRIFSKYGQLLTMIEKGDRDALRLGFRLFTIADGHVAEGLQIEIGKLINSYPRLFLQELKNHQKLIVSLGGLVGNYGPDFVDNQELHLKETEKRIESIKLINDPDLIETRDACIKELEQNK